MKKSLLLAATALLALLAACKDEPATGNPNYWASNDLRKMQLRGSVRELTEPDYPLSERAYAFDANGRLTSAAFPLLIEDMVILASYTYRRGANNEITSVTSNDNITYSYRYGNHGAYVPVGFYNLHNVNFFDSDYATPTPIDLVHNLSSTTAIGRGFNYTETYQVAGNTLKIYMEKNYSNAPEHNRKDTLTVTLNGSKYPLRGVNAKGLEIIRLGYYANNMPMQQKLSEYDEKGVLVSMQTIDYMTDDERIMTSKVTEYMVVPNATETTTRNITAVYSYNNYKDVAAIVYSGHPTISKQEYKYTEYEEYGNWTKRTITTTYTTATEKPTEQTETRTIGY